LLHTTTLLDLVEEPLDQVSVEIGAKANCDHQPQSCSDSAAARDIRAAIGKEAGKRVVVHLKQRIK
jgi:hypothetical protein